MSLLPASRSSSPLLADDIPNLTLSPQLLGMQIQVLRISSGALKATYRALSKANQKIWYLNAILLALFNPYSPFLMIKFVQFISFLSMEIIKHGFLLG
jgi:hypothetical protein